MGLHCGMSTKGGGGMVRGCGAASAEGAGQKKFKGGGVGSGGGGSPKREPIAA